MKTPFGQQSRRVAGPLLVWGLLLLALILTLLQARQGGLAALLSGERVLAYTLPNDGAALTLPLPPHATRLHLSTHALRPAPDEARARTTYLYGVEATVLDAEGHPLRRWPIWLRTRLSMEIEEGQEEGAAVVSEGGGVVTDGIDDRRLTLDGLGDAAAALSLRALATAGGEVLVQAWAALPQNEEEVARLEAGFPFYEQARFAAGQGTLPWAALTEAERTAAHAVRWARLAAAGREGEDYHTTALRITTFRRSWREASSDEQALRPGQAVAWNLSGPATLHLTALPPEDLSLSAVAVREGRAGEAWIAGELARAPSLPRGLRISGADGPVQIAARSNGWDITVAAEATASVHLRDRRALPLANDGSAPLLPVLTELTTGDPRHNPAWGRPLSVTLQSNTLALTAPDLVALPTWRTGPGDPPIFARVLPGQPVQVTARLPLPTLQDAGLGRLTLEEQDAEGRVLASHPWPIAAAASPYERYRQAPSLLPWPSEPVDVFLRPLPDTTRLKITCDPPMDLAVSVWDPPEHPAAPLLGYSALPDTPVSARYLPIDYSPWAARWPDNQEELARAGLATRVDAIVRLEPFSVTQGGEIAATNSLIPLGDPPAWSVLEPLPRAGRPWTPGDRLALPATVVLPDPPDPRMDAPPLLWSVAPSALDRALGGALRVLLDGQPVATAPLLVPVGRISLPTIPPGRHEITLDPPLDPATMQAWVGLPGEGAVEQLRKIYALEQGVRLSVPVRAEAPTILYVRVYHPKGRSGAVVWSIDGGAPRLGVGPAHRLTVSSGVATPSAPPRPARLLDAQGSAFSEVGAVRIVLGDDLAPGAHTVSLRGPAGSYARFDATVAPQREAAWVFWAEGVP